MLRFESSGLSPTSHASSSIRRSLHMPRTGSAPGRRGVAVSLRLAAAFLALLVGPLAAADVQMARASRTDYTGGELYAQHCARCHAQGVAGAPRPGMVDEWRGRLTAGRATLLLSVIKGQGGMPPKGGNASLTTAEAEAALAYMLSVPAR
jgi:cytochrome c5